MGRILSRASAPPEERTVIVVPAGASAQGGDEGGCRESDGEGRIVSGLEIKSGGRIADEGERARAHELRLVAVHQRDLAGEDGDRANAPERPARRGRGTE